MGQKANYLKKSSIGFWSFFPHKEREASVNKAHFL